MFGVRDRECSNVWGYGRRVLQCFGLGSRSAPIFGVKVRDCSNVWG